MIKIVWEDCQGKHFSLPQKHSEELDPRAAMRDQSRGSSQETDCNKGANKTKSTSLTCQQTLAIPMQYVAEMLTNKLNSL